MKDLENKNYTVRFYDKGLKEHFYFAGFCENGIINGKKNIAPTGCPVVVKKMTKAIEMLDAVEESIINAYEIKTSLRRNKISEMMNNETWMDCKKAIELNFCDEMLTREEQDIIERELEPQMFEKKVIEANLRNKLEEKYLIKKTEEPTGIPVEDVFKRLDLIKKII